MPTNRIKTYFYLVVTEEDPPMAVSLKHDTLESANNDAKLLAYLNPGKSFVVMEAVSGYQIDNLIKIEYTAAHNNPEDPNYVPF